MLNPYLFLLAFLLISLTNALFEQTNSVKKINSTIELADTYLNIDFLTAMLFYRSSSRSEFLEPIYIEFAETNKDFYRFVAVDCDSIDKDAKKEITPACREDFRDSLPQILFLEPPKERVDPVSGNLSQPIQHRYEGPASLEEFVSFAKKIMPNFSKKLISLDDLEKFLADQPQLNKALLLTNKKSVPQYWKALTSYFKDILSFGETTSKATKIFKKYDIDSFPTILILSKSQTGFNENVYNGELDYQSLSRYLKKFAEPRKKRARTTLEVNKRTADPDGNPLTKVPIKNIFPETFEDIVYGTERIVMVHLFKKEEFHETFLEVYSNFFTILDIYNLNCTEPGTQKFCTEKLQVKSLPAYRLYPIGNKENKSRSKIVLSKSKKFKEIGRDISDLVDDPLIQIDSSKLNSYLETVVFTKVPALILFHNQDEISLSLRVLAQLEPYNNRIRFASFRNPSEKVKKEFSIDELPKMLIVFVSDPERSTISIQEGTQTAKYAGNFTYDAIRHFLNKFLPSNVRSLAFSKQIAQVDSMKEFNLFCQNKMIGCVIGLIDGFSSNDYAEQRIQKELLVLEKVKSNFKQKNLIFVWVDVVCHPEFMKSLDVTVEQLPALIYYHHSNKIVTQLSGSYDYDNINTFLEEILKGSESASKTISEPPKIRAQICGIFHVQRDPEELEKLSPEPLEESNGSKSLGHDDKEKKLTSKGQDEL